jgi:hypothetical protein
MNLPPLIAFTGRAGSGKSTAAEALEKVGFERVKFADPLKDMLRVLYSYAGLPDVEIERRIEGDLKQEKDGFLCGQTPRHAMQTLGTEWGRNLIGTDLWVSAWADKVYSILMDGVPVVVDDCRFRNEAEALRKIGGKIVQVEGRSAGLEATHASEQFDLVPDEVISNTGSYHEFQANVIALYGARTAVAYREMTPEEFEDSLAALSGDRQAYSFRDICEGTANRVYEAMVTEGEDAAADIIADLMLGHGLDGPFETEAEARDGGPYAEIWDSRKRTGTTALDLQEAYRALLMADTNLMGEAALAIRHIGRAEWSTYSPAEVTALLFYIDCIGAGLPFDADGMDSFLASVGVESPSL